MFSKKKSINCNEGESFPPQQSKSSHLASIFDDPPALEKTGGRSSLHYIPPKQPKSGTEVATATLSRSSTPASQQAGAADTNPVLLALKVDLSIVKDVDNQAKQVGIAVSCILAPKQKFSPSTWLLYQNPKSPLAKFLIDDSLSLSVISNECLQMHGASTSSTKWLLKTTPEQLVVLLLQIYACKAVVEGSRVTTALLCPALPSSASTSALQALDWTEVCIRTVEISATGRVKQGVGGEEERVRVCVSSTLGEGTPEYAAHLLGAKKTERRLVVCKNGDVFRGYDVTIEKIKRRKPRSSCSTPAPSEGATVRPHGGDDAPHTSRGALLSVPGADDDSPASSDGSRAAGRHVAPGAATVVEEAVEGTPPTKASVLSRIARMGQPVFGVPATSSAALDPVAAAADPVAAAADPVAAAADPVAAAADPVAAAPDTFDDFTASSAADHELVDVPQPTSGATFGCATRSGNISAQACEPPGHVAGSPQSCLNNADVDTTAPKDERVVSSDGRSPNSFQPISSSAVQTESVGLQYVKDDLKIDRSSSASLTAEQGNLTSQKTSMGSHPFPLNNQQAFESSGFMQPVPRSAAAAVVRHPLPNAADVHGFHLPSLSNPNFYNPAAATTPHNAAHGHSQSTPYNAAQQHMPPYSSAFSHYNSFNSSHLIASPHLQNNVALYPPPPGPHPFHLPSPAAQAELPLSLLLSESRSQNTELRIAVARMANQVADIQNKMQEALSTRNNASEVELLDTFSTRVNSRISDIFSSQQRKEVTASENLAVARHQVALLRRALVAHCPELERVAGDATPVSCMSSDVISWAEDSRETDFMDKVIELASAGKLVYCRNSLQNPETSGLPVRDITSRRMRRKERRKTANANETHSTNVSAEKYSQTLTELPVLSSKASAMYVKMFEKKCCELQRGLSSSKQLTEDSSLTVGVHTATQNDGKLATDKMPEPHEAHASREIIYGNAPDGPHGADDSSSFGSGIRTNESEVNYHTIETEVSEHTIETEVSEHTVETEVSDHANEFGTSPGGSVSVLVAGKSTSSLERNWEDLKAASDELLKQLKSSNVDVLESSASKSHEEDDLLNTVKEKLRSIVAGCDRLGLAASTASAPGSGLVEGAFVTHSEGEDISKLKEENENLRELVKMKDESIHDLETLMSQELKLKDDALEEMNVSKIGVEAELLELSAAQQSMEGDLRLLRQQTVNLRQMADKYKRKCLEPKPSAELPNGDIASKPACDSENEKDDEKIALHGSSFAKKMHSISIQTDLMTTTARFEGRTTAPWSTCDAITQTIAFGGDVLTSSTPVVIHGNGVSTQTVGAAVESTGATTQTIPIAVESTGATTQTIPTAVESTGATTQTIPTAVESTGATTQTIPTAVESTRATTQTIPTAVESTGATTQTIPSAVESSGATTQTVLTSNVHPSCDASTQTTLELAELPETSSELRYSVEELEESVSSGMKKAMNAVYKSTKELFSVGQQYEGKDIRRLVQSVIRDTTLQYLEVFARQQDERRQRRHQELLNENQALQVQREDMEELQRQLTKEKEQLQEQILSKLHENGMEKNDSQLQERVNLLQSPEQDEEQSSVNRPAHSSAPSSGKFSEENVEAQTELCKTDDGCQTSLAERTSEEAKLSKLIDNNWCANEIVEGVLEGIKPNKDQFNTHNEEKIESELGYDEQPYNCEAKINQGCNGDNGPDFGQDVHSVLTVGGLRGSDASGVQERLPSSREEKEDEHSDQNVNARENAERISELPLSLEKSDDRPADQEKIRPKIQGQDDVPRLIDVQKDGEQLTDKQESVMGDEQRESDTHGAEGQKNIQGIQGPVDGTLESGDRLQENQDELHDQELNDNFEKRQEKSNNLQDLASSNSTIETREPRNHDFRDSSANLSNYQEPNKNVIEDENVKDHPIKEPNEAHRERQLMDSSGVNEAQTSLLNQPDVSGAAPPRGLFSSTPAPGAVPARSHEIHSYSSQPPPMPLFSSDEDDDWFT